MIIIVIIQGVPTIKVLGTTVRLTCAGSITEKKE